MVSWWGCEEQLEYYLAEDYHQKHWLQNEPAIMMEFRQIFPDMADFVASTAAARVNGYLRGYMAR